MKKMVITLKQTPPRNAVARALRTNALFKQRIVKSKKAYNRKRFKKGKDLLDE